MLGAPSAGGSQVKEKKAAYGGWAQIEGPCPLYRATQVWEEGGWVPEPGGVGQMAGLELAGRRPFREKPSLEGVLMPSKGEGA